MAVSHVSFNLSLGSKSCYRVDDDDVDGPGTDQALSDLKGLLTVIRLAYP